jgi:hypothetical protein
MASDELKNLLNPNAGGDLGDIVAIVAANLRENGDLVVIAISSAWASRLRYETDALLAAARKSGVSAQSCRIRVAQG